MNKTITILLTFLLIGISHSTYAFPRNDLKPGGIAIIPVARSNTPKPNVYYTKKSVAVIKGKTNWLAIAGISLDAKTGNHHVTVQDRNGRVHKSSFKVNSHKYRTQRLTIKNKNKVNPNKKSMNRIIKEKKLKENLIKVFRPTTPDLSFIKPVGGRDSGRFGARRIFNKQKRKPHSGMDIASPSGRSIKAASSGKVLYSGDLFFTGKVIYLDHGQGLISLYAHLSKSLVKKGQVIRKGQIIGKVGKTGRVTGPHLHWSIYLNGNAVDPALFLP